MIFPKTFLGENFFETITQITCSKTTEKILRFSIHFFASRIFAKIEGHLLIPQTLIFVNYSTSSFIWLKKILEKKNRLTGQSSHFYQVFAILLYRAHFLSKLSVAGSFPFSHWLNVRPMINNKKNRLKFGRHIFMNIFFFVTIVVNFFRLVLTLKRFPG